VERQAIIEFKGSYFEREMILWDVRWYLAYPISYQQLKEMMGERGVELAHFHAQSPGAEKYVPLLEAPFRARKRPVGSNWRLDKTSVKLKGVLEVPVPSGR
jgi:putative transposase